MSDDDKPFSSMQFVPPGDGAEIARLQERVRVMEATVGEFRGDLKEIKVGMQLILAHHLKSEKTRRAWEYVVGPINVILWTAVGAGLMYVFALSAHVMMQ